MKIHSEKKGGFLGWEMLPEKQMVNILSAPLFATEMHFWALSTRVIGRHPAARSRGIV